jgi:hypothetical protein
MSTLVTDGLLFTNSKLSRKGTSRNLRWTSKEGENTACNSSRLSGRIITRPYKSETATTKAARARANFDGVALTYFHPITPNIVAIP